MLLWGKYRLKWFMYYFHLTISILWAMYYNFPHFTDNELKHRGMKQKNPRSQESNDLKFEYTKASVSPDHQAYYLTSSAVCALFFLAISTQGIEKSYTHPTSKPTLPNYWLTPPTWKIKESGRGNKVIKQSASSSWHSFRGRKLRSSSRSYSMYSFLK